MDHNQGSADLLLRETAEPLGDDLVHGRGLGADPDPDTLQRYLYRGERARPFYLV